MMWGAVAMAAIFLFSLEGLRPPRPKPAGAPANQFSAGRAMNVLRRLVGDDRPHPVGSRANDAVRARIIDELQKLGYQPEVQNAFECGEYGTCATVNNVLARLDGSEDATAAHPGETPGRPAVLLVSHYDSVPAGPGASDDGAGTAALLEIARALKSMPAPRHSIVILIDDGEEVGLLGARAFVRSHRWSKDVRAAVNLDARGTSGPSLMFETGSANDWVVRLYAKHAAHPATSSIFSFASKQFPNDTDFSVFKAAGIEGLNFAYIGDVVHYHTPLDSIANVSAASLQHHGDNALPSVLALANADLSKPPPGERVFLDVFERWTIGWPRNWTLPLGMAAFVLLVSEVGWSVRTRRLAIGEFRWGLIGWLVTMVATGTLALVLERLIGAAGALPVGWTALPLPVEVTVWSVAAAVVVNMAIVFARRAGFWGLWAGTWTWWSLLSIVIGWREAGIDYVLLIPSGVAAVAGLSLAFGRSETAREAGVGPAVFAPLAAAGMVGVAPALLLYQAFGNRALTLIALFVALLLTPVAPLCVGLEKIPGRMGALWSWIPISATVLAAFASAIAPVYSAKAPERVNIRYWQDADSGKSQWIVHPDSGSVPEPIRARATFHRIARGPFPWELRPAFLTEAPRLELAPPSFTILESSQTSRQHSYRALLRSERGAPEAMALFPPGTDIESVRLEGVPIEPQSDRTRRYFGGWTGYRCVTMPAGGVEISFALAAGKLVQVYLLDATFGLPPGGASLLTSRPQTATPSQDGDLTIVSRRVELLP
jgi:peptidase M28-like protein